MSKRILDEFGTEDEQMSFDLDLLFNLEGFGESRPPSTLLMTSSSSLMSPTSDAHTSAAPDPPNCDSAKELEDAKNIESVNGDEEIGQNVTSNEITEHEVEFNLHAMAGNVMQDKIEALELEKKEWRGKIEEYEKANRRLQKRLTGSYEAQVDVPSEVVACLNTLERENLRLRSEVKELKDKIEEMGRENIVLYEENSGKSRKLKGANKKVKNAKDVAGKEEEKAKGAVHEKLQRQAAERKMKIERNEALAELQKYKKMNEDLGSELKIERAGRPHLREDGVEHDYTTVVVPVEFKIHRGDFRKLAMILDSNQMKIVGGFKQWYKEWKKPMDEKVKVVGADYVDDKKKKLKIGVDISDDTNEFQRGSGIPETGAEHDGWRSKRELEAICRQAQARANSLH